jgi:uncharacterized protein
LVYKFGAADNYYLYDVSSNNILRVDESIFNAIDYFMEGQTYQETGSQPTKGPVDVPPILGEAYVQLSKFREERNLLLADRPRSMFAFSMEQIKETLENNLEQLVLNVTESCNLRCEYCVYSGRYKYERTHSSAMMSHSTAFRAVDYFFKKNSLSKRVGISFYGGEPLLNFPLIAKIVEYSKSAMETCGAGKRLAFSITTNGTMLNNGTVPFLVNNEIGLLVSLDGPKILHDLNRKTINGNGTFSLVCGNLSKLRRAHPKYYREKVGFSAVAKPDMLEEILDFFTNSDLVSENSNLIINTINPYDTDFYSKGDIEHAKTKYNKNAESFLDQYKNLLIKRNYSSKQLRPLAALYHKNLLNIHNRVLTPLDNKINLNACCVPGGRKLFVGASGGFYICEKMGESIGIGDISRGFDYKSIMRLIGQYHDMSEPICPGCWVNRICPLCYVSARVGSVFHSERKRSQCEGTRQIAGRFLKLYCEIMEQNPDLSAYLDKYHVN